MIKYIKDKYNESKESSFSDERLLEWAQSFLNLHRDEVKDYTEKYNQYKINIIHEAKYNQETQDKLEIKDIHGINDTFTDA